MRLPLIVWQMAQPNRPETGTALRLYWGWPPSRTCRVWPSLASLRSPPRCTSQSGVVIRRSSGVAVILWGAALGGPSAVPQPPRRYNGDFHRGLWHLALAGLG